MTAKLVDLHTGEETSVNLPLNMDIWVDHSRKITITVNEEGIPSVQMPYSNVIFSQSKGSFYAHAV